MPDKISIDEDGVHKKRIPWNKGMKTGTYRGSNQNKADKARWQREWRAKNPVTARSTWDEWESKTDHDAKATGRKNHLKRYGMTPEDYERLLHQQRGVCAICYKPPTEAYFVIDHDHKRNKVRGLLHRKCNAGIGQFGDDLALVRRAAEYLEFYDAVEV